MTEPISKDPVRGLLATVSLRIRQDNSESLSGFEHVMLEVEYEEEHEGHLILNVVDEC